MSTHKGPNSRESPLPQIDELQYRGKRKESFTMAMIMASKEENRTSAPREPKCIEGHRTLYSNEYDAYYCADCMAWLTEKCVHEGCNHCNKRPKYPDAA